MLIASTFAALVMFAAPDAASAGDQATEAKPAVTAEAKPATKRVCESIQVSGSNLPKKKCRDVPVKPTAQVAQDGSKADAPKSE